MREQQILIAPSKTLPTQTFTTPPSPPNSTILLDQNTLETTLPNNPTTQFRDIRSNSNTHTTHITNTKTNKTKAIDYLPIRFTIKSGRTKIFQVTNMIANCLTTEQNNSRTVQHISKSENLSEKQFEKESMKPTIMSLGMSKGCA